MTKQQKTPKSQLDFLAILFRDIETAALRAVICEGMDEAFFVETAGQFYRAIEKQMKKVSQ